MIKYIYIFFLLLISLNYFGQSTKIRLFEQTNLFDSIVTSYDSIYFYSSDTLIKGGPLDLDSLNELFDSISFRDDTLSIYENSVTTRKVEIIAGKDNDYELSIPNHGLQVPSWGIRPLYFNHTTGNYEYAQADSIHKAADVLMVDSIDQDQILIQNTGYLEIAHGLQVGIWYILDTANPGGVIPAFDTCLVVGEPIQYLFFTADANQILIQPEQPIECDSSNLLTTLNPFAACGGFDLDYWDEDFSTQPNGTNTDTDSTAWTVDDNGVDAGLDAVEMDNSTWQTTAIDIECVSGNITIIVDLFETGNLDGGDFIESEYRLDGGAWIQFGINFNDFGSTTHTVTFASGTASTLEIRINSANDGGEDHYIDRVRLQD